MTLLEALVALAILGLSAIGSLEVFQGAMQGARQSREWVYATARAESALEAAVLAAARGESVAMADGLTRVTVRPWRGPLVDIVVTIRLPDGRELVVHRLTRRR